jgi:hypothetical protein
MTMSSYVHRGIFVAYGKGLPKQMFDFKMFFPLDIAPRFSDFIRCPPATFEFNYRP